MKTQYSFGKQKTKQRNEETETNLTNAVHVGQERFIFIKS